MQNLISYLVAAKSCRDCESALPGAMAQCLTYKLKCLLVYFTLMPPWLWSRNVTVPSTPLLGKKLSAVGLEGQTPATSSSSAQQESTGLMAQNSYSDLQALVYFGLIYLVNAT